MALIFLMGCESKQLNILEQPSPYAQHGIGVEGYMGVAMTSCLGMPPLGPPVQKRLKNGTVINPPPIPKNPAKNPTGSAVKIIKSTNNEYSFDRISLINLSC